MLVNRTKQQELSQQTWRPTTSQIFLLPHDVVSHQHLSYHNIHRIPSCRIGFNQYLSSQFRIKYLTSQTNENQQLLYHPIILGASTVNFPLDYLTSNTCMMTTTNASTQWHSFFPSIAVQPLLASTLLWKSLMTCGACPHTTQSVVRCRYLSNIHWPIICTERDHSWPFARNRIKILYNLSLCAT